MFFGNLAGKESPIKGWYRFTGRGQDKDILPDLLSEKCSKDEIPFCEGSLFDGTGVGFSWLKILDLGFDIDFSLSESVFIDRIKILQKNESAIKSIKFFVKEDDVNVLKGRFDPQTGKLISENGFDLLAGVYAKDFILRFESDFHDILIEKLEIMGAVYGENPVYPLPYSYNQKGPGKIPVGDITKICYTEDAVFPARLLKEKLNEKFSVDAQLSSNFVNSCESGVVYIEKGSFDSEGYVFDVSNGSVYIKGADLRGMIYGIETLLNIAGKGFIPECTIKDKPFLNLRGAHFGLPPREEIGFFKRLIRYVLVPMRINTLFLEVAGGMRFESHPLINEMWEKANILASEGKWPAFPHGTMVSGGKVLEKDEVRDIIEYAQSFGIDVIPEVQSLGHVQYITVAYPEVGETEFEEEKDDFDLKVEDIPPSKFYKDSYCASNEKSYKIIFDLMDEIIDVFRPEEYVHMGHDEVYTIGTCPVCKGKDPAELYYSDVMKLYDHLKSKNLKMMIWADMLHDVTKYLTPPAIKKIPRDIIMLDFIWYFHLDKDIEDHLLDNGFKVVMGNMYSSHYPRYEKRIRKEGMIGAQVSTWKRVDEYNMGFEGKIYDFIYSSNMMWSEKYDSDLRMSYDEICAGIIPFIRNMLHGKGNHSLKQTIREEIRIDDHRIAKIEATDLKAVLIDSEDKLCIDVGNKYSSIIFNHASKHTGRRITWVDPHYIGKYTVEYTDGTTGEIRVEYGANIGHLNSRYARPLEHPYYRHQGYISTYFADPVMKKDLNGNDITIFSYEWINPFENKTIKCICAQSDKDADTPYYIFKLEGIK